MNKKGMDISLNFIILAVLALIALIVIALFFTGGLTSLFKQTEEVGGVSAETIALYKSKCALSCTTNDFSGWCNPSLSEDLTEAGVDNCDDLYEYQDGILDDKWIESGGDYDCVDADSDTSGEKEATCS